MAVRKVEQVVSIVDSVQLRSIPGKLYEMHCQKTRAYKKVNNAKYLTLCSVLIVDS